MQSTNIFAPLSSLPADVSDRDKGQVLNEQPEWYLSRILANIAMLAAGSLGGIFKQVPITFSTDTSIYASGDVLADTQPLSGALRLAGGSGKLTQITLVDKDDQTAAGIDVVILKSNKSIGTENAAPSIADADMGEILGVVSIASSEFIDMGGAKVGTHTLAVPLQVYADSGTTLYVALITRGTPTQTASGLVGQFFFRQD